MTISKEQSLEQIEAENKITLSNKTLEELEKIFSEAHEEAKKETYLADVLDCFDYWIPELIRRTSAYLGIIKTDTKGVEEKTGDIIAKKGQKVKFFCCTHDFGSKSSDAWEMDDDCTEDDLEFAAREYAHETKQLEWWYEIVDE